MTRQMHAGAAWGARREVGYATPRVGRLVLFTSVVLFACSRDKEADGASATTAKAAAETSAVSAATPVRTAVVTRGNMPVIVSGPGRTEALDVQKVRAPFAGTLQSLRVVVGDRVQAGETIGAMVSQASQSALAGAEIMLQSATTAAQRSDAQRALELAKQNLVETLLRAPRAGLIVSRGASEGDLLSPGDSIVGIASEGSIVFIARIAQSDVGLIRAGQAAAIDAPGRPMPVFGMVHGFLPADTVAMTVSVRIDLGRDAASIPLGMFGTARVTVSQHFNVAIVPLAAILRDDISGQSRVATVTSAGRVLWLTVTVGVQRGDAVEIQNPPIPARTRVIVSGQVGLADGTRVTESTDAATPPSAATARGSVRTP